MEELADCLCKKSKIKSLKFVKAEELIAAHLEQCTPLHVEPHGVGKAFVQIDLDNCPGRRRGDSGHLQEDIRRDCVGWG